MKIKKTNALRILDQHHIPYEVFTYDFDDDDPTGKKAKDQKMFDENATFKTLVLKGERKGYLVCCIPTTKEIDLKKLATAFKDKKVEMIAMKDLLSITGYIRGGCSPVGMKKKYPTFFDESCLKFKQIALSAGQRGMSMIVEVEKLINLVEATCADVIKD